MALSSRFRRCTISGGVPGGAKTPNQLLKSMPVMPISAKVGTLGIEVERRLPLTARGRTLPSPMWGCAETMLSIRNAICPATRSVMTRPVPRYGMCTTKRPPARHLNISADRCG